LKTSRVTINKAHSLRNKDQQGGFITNNRKVKRK
jgi:hypothetical protein